nr:WPE palindromic element domain-containing protein [Wolbachia endosymbiont (group A) of Trypoxylon clavicerum]
MGVIPVPRHWDPENLIVYYTTFSIKSWIPVSSTGMTSQGHWNFCFNICRLCGQNFREAIQELQQN